MNSIENNENKIVTEIGSVFEQQSYKGWNIMALVTTIETIPGIKHFSPDSGFKNDLQIIRREALSQEEILHLIH